MWVDDPRDRLLPTRETLQSLRAFANHAMSAVESARQLELMRHLAEHDPLTGLRNRRGLQEHIDAEIARTGTVAVLVCDLDNFKRVNDALGYVQGDEALRRFAGVLATAGGLAARLGGEEFALVLPGTPRTPRWRPPSASAPRSLHVFDDFPWPVTTSVGVAVSGPGAETASLLLRAATRAVFGAKRLGRDRCVPYHAETLEPLLGTLEDAGGASGEQLAAAMLLAETLDMRDVGTARHSQTVGRYAEAIARALGLPRGPRRARSAPPACCTTSASSASPTPCSRSRARSPTRSGSRCAGTPSSARASSHHANLRDISAWVLAHHERIDGRGYPHGLAGDRDPARGADPRRRRRLRGDDRRPRLPRRAGHDAAQKELRRVRRARSSTRASSKRSCACSHRAGGREPPRA